MDQCTRRLIGFGVRGGPEEMTGHGFRSMDSTLLHEMGWNHQVIERQLAHAERDTVSAAYNFAEHLAERRKMMQAWADYLDGLKATGEVAPRNISAMPSSPFSPVR